MAAKVSFYRHTLDIRLGDIDVFTGKLKLVLLGAYQQGGNFTTSRGGEGHVPIRAEWAVDLFTNTTYLRRGASLASFSSPLSMVGDLLISTAAVST